MKPLNLDNRPCSPISSNCVIWQGPDIPCIKLCTGDTVSDVIFKLATELCTIMDQLKVSNYDLSCLNLTACPPEDFQALIQLLIEKICELNGITPDEGKSAGCPDCVVSVAPCLVQNGQTTMQLVDYVQMIANRLCSIISEIDSINDQISTINSTLIDLQYQIDNLPTYTLPSIEMDCILSGDQPLDAVVAALVNNETLGYCALINATGTPVEINTAVLSQCISDGDQPLSALPAVNTFSAYYSGSWVNAAALGADPSVSNAIKNIWVAVCDMYNYVSNLNTGITVQDTNTVNLTYTSGTLIATVQDTGWVPLEGFNTYMILSSGTQYTLPEVRRIGNVLHFRGPIIIPLDAGGAVLPWVYTSSQNNYERDPSTGNAVTLKAPYTGAGGVVLGSFGSLQFNSNGVSAQSVIPTSVIPSGYALDGSYGQPARFQVATRIIQIGDNTSTILTSLFGIGISSTGILGLGLVKNAEESFINSSDNAFDTSHLNYIISHVVAGENVPQFKTSTNIVHSKPVPTPPTPSNSDLNLDFPTNYTYPFSCNANDEDEIGGFTMRLDGLTAFISPCGTLIPTPDPCGPK